MRKALLMSAALLGFAGSPVFAQNSTQSTTSPPAPNASSSMPEPTNSLPAGAGTARRTMPGNTLGTTRIAPMASVPTEQTGTAMTGMRPMRGQRGYAAMHGRPEGRMMGHGRMMGRGKMARGSVAQDGSTAQDGSAGVDAPRSGEYRGGAGSPLSTAASNTTAANTRSEIAPRLPDPAAASNTPQGYLQAAQRALGSGRTGAAQEALERAETRILSRSTDPSMAASPADMPMVRQIGAARRALATRDTAGARSAIDAALAGS